MSRSTSNVGQTDSTAPANSQDKTPRPAAGRSPRRNEEKKNIPGGVNAGTESAKVTTMEITNQVLQDRLKDVSERTYKFANEIERLRSEANVAETEAQTRYQHLQNELIRKEQANKALTRHVQELTQMQISDKEAMKKLIEKTLKQAEQIFLEKERVLLNKQQELVAELADLKQFQRIRADLLEELEATKAMMATNEARHQAQLENLERRFNLARERLEKEAAIRIAHSRETYKEEISRELDVESRFIRTENLRLAKELKFHEVSSQQFQKTSQELRDELARVKLDAELQAQRHETLARQCWKLKQENEQLTASVRSLEHALSTTTRDAALEQATWKAHATQRADQLAQELAETQRKLADRTQELKVIRMHAQNLLASRSELETFFADALAQVRAEVQEKEALERANAIKRRNQAIRDYALGSGGSISGNADALSQIPSLPALPASKQLDVRDLTPEQRYQIIRLMFARIRNSKATAYASQSIPDSSNEPVQSLAMGQEAGLLTNDTVPRPTSGNRRPISAGRRAGQQPPGLNSLTWVSSTPAFNIDATAASQEPVAKADRTDQPSNHLSSFFITEGNVLGDEPSGKSYISHDDDDVENRPFERTVY